MKKKKPDNETFNSTKGNFVKGWCGMCGIPKDFEWNGEIYVCEKCGAPYLKPEIEDTQGG